MTEASSSSSEGLDGYDIRCTAAALPPPVSNTTTEATPPREGSRGGVRQNLFRSNLQWQVPNVSSPRPTAEVGPKHPTGGKVSESANTNPLSPGNRQRSAMDDLAAEIKCPICLDPFKDPVTLPCNHNVCKDHVVDLAVLEEQSTGPSSKEAARPFHILCPKCRERADFPSLRAIKVNVEMKAIVELMLRMIVRQERTQGEGAGVGRPHSSSPQRLVSPGSEVRSPMKGKVGITSPHRGNVVSPKQGAGRVTTVVSPKSTAPHRHSPPRLPRRSSLKRATSRDGGRGKQHGVVRVRLPSSPTSGPDGFRVVPTREPIPVNHGTSPPMPPGIVNEARRGGPRRPVGGIDVTAGVDRQLRDEIEWEARESQFKELRRQREAEREEARRRREDDVQSGISEWVSSLPPRVTEPMYGEEAGSPPRAQPSESASPPRPSVPLLSPASEVARQVAEMEKFLEHEQRRFEQRRRRSNSSVQRQRLDEVRSAAKEQKADIAEQQAIKHELQRVMNQPVGHFMSDQEVAEEERRREKEKAEREKQRRLVQIDFEVERTLATVELKGNREHDEELTQEMKAEIAERRAREMLKSFETREKKKNQEKQTKTTFGGGRKPLPGFSS